MTKTTTATPAQALTQADLDHAVGGLLPAVRQLVPAVKTQPAAPVVNVAAIHGCDGSV